MATQAAGRPAASGSNTTSTVNNNTGPSASRDIPRDARLIGLILASLGATDADPGVVAMLLEFAHRYTLEVLQSAQAYAEHAARPRDSTAGGSGSGSNAQTAPPLELDDIRLAVASKLEHSYSSPLPKEFLLPLAAQINRVPLPILPESYGIRLPPQRERLTAPNWDILPLKERRTYPEIQAQDQQSADKADGGGDTEMELARGDLFGNEDDDDDDDDGDMEEVLDPTLQEQSNANEAQTNADDGEEEEDDDDDEEEDEEDDGEGDNDGEEEDEEEAEAQARGEDDDYDA